MFLKKVYINGFKSFAEKTEINFENGITAIVGPNGSGKSNISDAIKWVLGEQSAKTLRGGKMDDVIFAGTQKRMPLGYAEVNLIFDNRSGLIPLDYQEVSIKRKLFKTGESEYFINKQQCRLKDIRELFMDTGIGRDGYSFIGQGRVEDIISPNSETRREVFEEAAGIVKYKTRKEESEKKLSKTNDNLERIDDIINELKERIEPLKQQSEKAQTYIELKNKLKNYELNYLVHEYEKHNEQLTLLENQKSLSMEQKEKYQKKRNALEDIIISEKEKINIVQNNINELEALLLNKNKEFENYQNSININLEKNILFKNNYKSIKSEIEGLYDRNESLYNNLNDLKNEKINLEEKLQFNIEEFNAVNNDIEQYKEKIGSIIKDIEKHKGDLFEIHKVINKLISTKNTVQSFLKNDMDRIEQLTKEIVAEENELNNKNQSVNSLKLEQDNTLLALDSNKQELNDLLVESRNSQLIKTKLEAEVKKFNEELSGVKSKLKILTDMEAYYDGYYKSIKTLMNNKTRNDILKKSILGTVADIISTKKEYETAVETALGSSIQNVIVKKEEEAGNIIEYLKSNKIGRVTFLPIDLIQEKTLSKAERSILSNPCVINTGDMLVETNPEFQKVIKHLLGRIIIVDNLNNGFKISKQLGNSVKIVTLQGDVINAGGSVTGGYISNNQNLLGRKREIDECKILNIKYNEILENKNNELKIIHDKIYKCNEKVEALKNIINEKNNILAMTESKINMLREQAEKSSLVIQKYSNEKLYMEEEKTKHETELSELIVKIELLRDELENKERYINETSAINEENRKKYEEYNFAVLKQRDEVSQIKQDIKIAEEKISNVLSEINRNIDLIKSKEASIKAIENDIDAATNIINEYTSKSEILKEELSDINLNFNNVKGRMSNIQNDIYEYQNKINETNKNITAILDDENSINVKVEREKSRVEDISAKLWEEYEMNYAMALKYKDESVSQSRIYSEVNNYKKAIKELGNISLNSIEEYKEVKERYEFLTKQKKDMIDAKNQLIDVIKELQTKMEGKFLQEFYKIREKFGSVFKQLFNGGSGDIYLEEEANPLNSNIEIAVQPPGKKLSKISLLSGGEKTLTAIALLFAILKTKPTAFCILDEIEAALDDANIYRFSEYLKEFSKDTQFIVITHRKGTMEYADTLYGATMEEKGVTKVVSLKLTDFK